jgi:outer membrane protein assembly factor BamC
MLFKIFCLWTFVLLFNGCSTAEDYFDDLTAPDYVNSSKAERLEVPPDLSEIDSGENYSVPGEAKSYKEFLDRENRLITNSENPNKKKVIENPDGMKIIKSGNLRWLTVEKEPNILWPYIKDFWEELGFRVLVANKRTGIIETEWMDTEDIKLERNSDGVISAFDKWLDSLSGFADKRKFRTRVEYGENNTTEIYISQRSAAAAADQHSRILKERSADYNVSTIYKIEEYKSDDDSNKKKVEISEQREIDDYEIDSELLTRLMIKLGASNYEAENKVKNPNLVVRAEMIENQGIKFIKMNDPFDRSWRRLGLALDIIGFVTEDKNRSEGIYYVRFNQVDLPTESTEEEAGLIDSLIFWDHDEKKENDADKQVTENYKDADEIINPDDKTFTGIEAPEIKPINENDIVEETEEKSKWKSGEEETWLTGLWPSWGSEDEKKSLPDNEKRYRIRIKPIDDSTTKVYLDFPNGKINNSTDGNRVLSIINEYLK